MNYFQYWQLYLHYDSLIYEEKISFSFSRNICVFLYDKSFCKKILFSFPPWIKNGWKRLWASAKQLFEDMSFHSSVVLFFFWFFLESQKSVMSKMLFIFKLNESAVIWCIKYGMPAVIYDDTGQNTLGNKHYFHKLSNAR